MRKNGIRISLHGKTWLYSEEAAYPHGGQTRKGAARYPDGKIRRVWAGIPDTFFTVPAHGRYRGKYVAGYLSLEEEELVFTPTGKYRSIFGLT